MKIERNGKETHITCEDDTEVLLLKFGIAWYMDEYPYYSAEGEKRFDKAGQIYDLLDKYCENPNIVNLQNEYYQKEEKAKRLREKKQEEYNKIKMILPPNAISAHPITAGNITSGNCKIFGLNQNEDLSK